MKYTKKKLNNDYWLCEDGVLKVYSRDESFIDKLVEKMNGEGK